MQTNPLTGIGPTDISPTTRRRFLRRLGAAGLLAGMPGLAAGLFAGCSGELPPLPGQFSKRGPIRVGLLHSQTGSLALNENPVRDAETLAIEEINAAGGLLGRPVEIICPDTKSRTDLYPRRARTMLVDHNVAALFGGWTSDGRKVVLPLLKEFNRLLFYPLAYEGNESHHNVIYGGLLPNQQVLPAIDWLLSPSEGSRTKVFLIGTDLIYSRTANFVARKYLQSRGMQVMGEILVPLGGRDFAPIVAQIRDSGCDCILSTITGDSNLAFYRELAAIGNDPRQRPVVATSIGENSLQSFLPEEVAGHYTARSYFQGLRSPENARWVETFRAEFGYDRVLSDSMEPGYALVHLWANAVRKCGALDADSVRQALADVEFAGPSGTLRVDPRTQHCGKRFRIGRVTTNREFEVIHESEQVIPPDPYPQFAFPGWSCDWTKDGLIPGPAVRFEL
ncbi:MAG: transporter substrate-binding protein [Planctomycetaceae bacterium]|jgi:urea ABC transporter urea binding protein